VMDDDNGSEAVWLIQWWKEGTKEARAPPHIDFQLSSCLRPPYVCQGHVNDQTFPIDHHDVYGHSVVAEETPQTTRHDEMADVDVQLDHVIYQ
jgi:hypothetical protein